MGEKVTFDIVNRIITIDVAPTTDPFSGDPVIDIDVKVDLYSDGKEDWLANPSFRALIFPIRVVGGDPIPTGFLDGSFFLRSDWKIQPYDADHRLRIDGNFYSEDGTTPFLFATGRTVIIEQNLSAIVGSTFADEEALVLAANFSADPFVYFDSIGGTTDLTSDTAGTLINPVQNEADAFTLAQNRNKKAISIVDGTFVLDRNVNNFIFAGPGDPQNSRMNLNGWMATGCTFREVTLTGNGAGSRVYANNNTILDGLSNIEGLFDDCFIRDLTLDSGAGTAIFKNCRSGSITGSTATVNCSGRSGNIKFRGFVGGIELLNLTNANTFVTIDLEAGDIVLGPTNTDVAGLDIHGVGSFHNTSSIAAAKIDEDGFINNPIQRILSIVKALLGLS